MDNLEFLLVPAEDKCSSNAASLSLRIDTANSETTLRLHLSVSVPLTVPVGQFQLHSTRTVTGTQAMLAYYPRPGRRSS